MLCDIFMTFKDRDELFERSLCSFYENTDPSLYRLTLVCDGGYVPEFITDCDNLGCMYDGVSKIDHILLHRDNIGLGPSINQALTHVDALNQYYSHPQVGDPQKVSEFVCMCQDDLLYTQHWLEKMAKFFTLFEYNKNLGFASCIECIEHEMCEDLGEIQGTRLITKDWIRAAMMFGRRDYWMSMFPIPMLDGETGRKRAKPNNGMGSGVDWHFIRQHENSVCKTGRTNLVLPGVCQHAGFAYSTWLDREMPESGEDKEMMMHHIADDLTREAQRLGMYDEDPWD